MTNGEKYAGETHNHYVYERMCPKCNYFWCRCEPSDFRKCVIKDVYDYKEWLLQEADEGYQRRRKTPSFSYGDISRVLRIYVSN